MTKSLTKRQNGVIRSAIERLVEERFAGNRRNAAAALGVAPSFLSDVLRQKRGAGIKIVFGLVRYAPYAVSRAMSLESTLIPALGGLPNLQRALAMCAANQMADTTLAYGAMQASCWRVDRDVGEWVSMLEAFDRSHEEDAPPHSRPTVACATASSRARPHSAPADVTV